MVGTTSTQMSARMPAHVLAVALIALTAAVATLLALAATAAAAGPIDLDRVDDSGVRSYWTPERMEAAQPLDPVSAALGRRRSRRARSRPTCREHRRAELGRRRRRAYTRTEVPDPAAASVRMQGKVFLTVARGAGGRRLRLLRHRAQLEQPQRRLDRGPLRLRRRAAAT